jgi:steroid delta-isomerase-like uncharacterized protein
MSNVKQLAEQGWNAWFSRDIDAVMQFYAEDAELILPGGPPVKGKDAIRAAWQMYMTAFPDERPTEIRHFADGNTAITEWTIAQTHTGPLAMPTGEMLPATGKAITLNGVTVAELEGDKVKRQAFYWDNADFLQQLGLMPTQELVAAG